MDTIAAPVSITHGTYLDIQIVLDVVAFSFVAVRVWTNWRYTSKVSADDYASFIAVISLIGYSMSSYLLTRAFADPDAAVSTLTRLSVACLYTAAFAMYFAKAPLLLLYIRLFWIETWLRFTCYVTLAVTAIVHLVCAIYASIGCIPSDGKYESTFVLKCAEATHIPVLLRCFAAIATDVVALILPLMVVAKLHLPTSRKIGLVLVFSAGIFAMAAGCVSLYYQWRMKDTANSADMTVGMLWTCLECTVAIIVACAPAFNTLYKGCIERARRASALKSSSGGAEEAKKASPLQQIRVTTHHYMEVDNNNHKRAPGYQAEVMGNRRADWDSDSIA